MENASALIAPALTGVLLGLGGRELSAGVLANCTLVGVVGLQYILIGALDVLYVVLAITTLGIGESGAGYLNSAFGLGGLIGVAVAAMLVARRRLAPALTAGILTAALALGVLGIFPTVVGAFVLLAVAGLSRSVFDVTGRILLQRAAPPHVMGQVFALLESLMNAGLAFAAIAWRRLRTIYAAADLPQVQIQLLRSTPIFIPLPAPEIEGLARALVPVEAAAGATLITESEPRDCFYATVGGRVGVTKRGQDVATLGCGQGFGEIALIQDVPRTATVVALTDVSLCSLDKEPFVLALTGRAPARGRPTTWWRSGWRSSGRSERGPRAQAATAPRGAAGAAAARRPPGRPALRRCPPCRTAT
jgi:hypothetical protein